MEACLPPLLQALAAARERQRGHQCPAVRRAEILLQCLYTTARALGLEGRWRARRATA